MQSLPFTPAATAIGKVSLPHISILNGPRPVAAGKKADKAAPDATALAKLILVGLDDQGKPHAAWFTEEQVDAATLAADMMDMASIAVEDEALTALAGVLPRGKLFESGKAFVPFTKRETYERLAAYLDSDFLVASAERVEAAKVAAETYAKASKGEVPLRLPEDWSKIAIGDIVLASEAVDDGWWFAEVLELSGDDKLRLRWRDFPEYPTITVGRTEVALLHPQYVQR